MFRISKDKVVEEQSGNLVLMQLNDRESKVTDKIVLDEHELKKLIEFSHNALGVPQEDPFPFD